MNKKRQLLVNIDEAEVPSGGSSQGRVKRCQTPVKAEQTSLQVNKLSPAALRHWRKDEVNVEFVILSSYRTKSKATEN